MTFSNYSITLALLSFFSTTVDDFCVILIFFAREYVKTHSLSHPETVLSFIKISVGQLIGFSIIVGVSLVLGIGLHSVVDNDYIDLIGFLPIVIGLYKVYELLDEEGYLTRMYNLLCCRNPETAEAEATADVKDVPTAVGEKRPLIVHGVSGVEEEKASDVEGKLKPVAENTVEEGEIGTILNEEAIETLNELDQSNSFVVWMKTMFSFMDPLTFEVAIYALMFGTDNIAIYVALFSNVTLLEILAIIVFFYSLLLLYLFIAVFIIMQVCFGKFSSILSVSEPRYRSSP
jgi:cadmium resistance protein CadD (predicted permease)